MKLRVGISACLLGHLVRYDGGHKLDKFLVADLETRFALVPLCPEFEAGFGVPREPMHLLEDVCGPRLRTVQTGRDLTDRLLEWSRSRVEKFVEEGMWGVVLKSRSPSCGVASVSVVGHDGAPQRNGSGLFVRTMSTRFPGMPLIESDALQSRESILAFVAEVQEYCASQ